MAVIDPDEVWPLSLADGIAGPATYSPPGGSGIAVDAEPGPVSLGVDVGDAGRLALQGRQWVLRAKSLGNTPVVRNGRVADAGGRQWAVAGAVLTALGTAWVCQTVRLPLASEFPTTASVYRANPAPAAGGLPTAAPTVLSSGLPAAVWVESTASEWDQTQDRTVTRITATVYLGSTVQLRAGDSVVADGVAWEVLRQSGPGTYSALTAVSVQRIV